MANDITPATAKTPSLPRAVLSALTTSLEWDSRRALAELRQAGQLDALAHHAEVARHSLAPAPARWLADRLSTMQLAMSQGWSNAKATAWLHEMQRLLADLPQDIVGWALDEAVKGSARGFLPSVGEVRAHADPKWAERKRIATRLTALVDQRPALEKPKPAAEPADIVDPAEAARIIDECGLRMNANGNRPVVERVQGKPRAPTAAEIAALAADFAHPNDRADDVPVADITGLSLEQIGEQAARLKAERIARQLDQRRSAHASGSTLADEFDAMDRHAA